MTWIVQVDMADVGNHWMMLDFKTAALPYFGEGNVYYATRQLTEGRNITFFGRGGAANKNESETFSEIGRRSVSGYKARTFANFGTPIGTLRYGVRSDQVKRIEAVYARYEYKHGSPNRNNSLPERHRPLDVANFWKIDSVPGDHPGLKDYLRTQVSRAVHSLSSDEKTQPGNLNVTVGIKGQRYGEGRNGVTDDYAEALIDHKIVVVAQRDTWEGHYRLMEALAGGALVMTDPMHPLPYKLIDGDGLVVYTSLKELKEKILYYMEHPTERLRIAARGHYVAMNYHRSWHVVERLLLGNWTENNVY